MQYIKLIIFGSDRKKQQNSVVPWKKGMSKKNQGLRQVELGTLRLGNDKNNIIPNKLLSYF